MYELCSETSCVGLARAANNGAPQQRWQYVCELTRVSSSVAAHSYVRMCGSERSKSSYQQLPTGRRSDRVGRLVVCSLSVTPTYPHPPTHPDTHPHPPSSLAMSPAPCVRAVALIFKCIYAVRAVRAPRAGAYPPRDIHL